jgi:hypothetical protein
MRKATIPIFFIAGVLGAGPVGLYAQSRDAGLDAGFEVDAPSAICTILVPYLDATPVPTMGPVGTAALVVLSVGAGVWLIWRRSR